MFFLIDKFCIRFKNHAYIFVGKLSLLRFYSFFVCLSKNKYNWKYNFWDFVVFYFLVTRKLSNNGLGMGDVHYSLYCGFLSSVFTSILSALFAALLSLFVFLIIFFINGKSRIKLLKLPFVPFLFVATVLGNLVTWGIW